MSSSRTILSRPRTRVYDANYNIGERYYKPMVDHLDRKYSGRYAEPPPPFPATARPSKDDDVTRPRRLLGDLEDDLDIPRRRAPSESESLFERSALNGRAASLGRAISNGRAVNGFDAATDDLMDEVTSSVRRLRTSRAQRLAEELADDFETTVSRRKEQALARHERGQSLADKHLEAVGITRSITTSTRDVEDDPIFRKRVLRISTTATEDSPDLTRWSKVNPISSVKDIVEDSAAMSRARKTRDRLADLESEIEDVAERSARRDRRAAELRSFLAENTERSTVEDSSSSSVRMSLKSEKKTVTF